MTLYRDPDITFGRICDEIRPDPGKRLHVFFGAPGLVRAHECPDERDFQHLVGRRRILDELEQARFVDHLARRHRQVAAQLERPLGALADLPALDVGEHVAQAGEQILALGLDRALHDLRVERKVIGRAHRIDEALGGEAQPAARGLVEALDLLHRAKQFVGDGKVALAHCVEVRAVAPFGAAEAAVL